MMWQVLVGFTKHQLFEIDRSVRESTIKLKDADFLAKLAGGEMVAIEAKYHVKCLAALYNRVRKLQTPLAVEDRNETSLHRIAFASLVSYLEEFRDCENVALFKLVELAKQSQSHLKHWWTWFLKVQV